MLGHVLSTRAPHVLYNMFQFTAAFHECDLLQLVLSACLIECRAQCQRKQPRGEAGWQPCQAAACTGAYWHHALEAAKGGGGLCRRWQGAQGWGTGPCTRAPAAAAKAAACQQEACCPGWLRSMQGTIKAGPWAGEIVELRGVSGYIALQLPCRDRALDQPHRSASAFCTASIRDLHILAAKCQLLSFWKLLSCR